MKFMIIILLLVSFAMLVSAGKACKAGEMKMPNGKCKKLVRRFNKYKTVLPLTLTIQIPIYSNNPELVQELLTISRVLKNCQNPLRRRYLLCATILV